jgi:hypothetical protein
MKKTLTIAAAFFGSAAFSQIVSISPTFATPSDTITITLDANSACTGAKQSVMDAPEVRIHSGVTINGTNWSNVVTFDATTQNTILTADTNNTGFYFITLVPNDFYSVNPGDIVTQLCMVFNGNSWDYEAKDFDATGTACQDFFIPLYGIGINENVLFNNVYPNPTTGTITLELMSRKAGIAGIKVVNILGQSVMSFERAVEAGVNTLNADLNIANGTYFVEVTVDGAKSVKRVVVAH